MELSTRAMSQLGLINKNLSFSQEKPKKINESNNPVFSVSCHANSKVGIHAPLITTIKENVSQNV